MSLLLILRFNLCCNHQAKPNLKLPGLRHLDLIDVDLEAALLLVEDGAEVGLGSAHRSLGDDQVDQLIVELPVRPDLTEHRLFLMKKKIFSLMKRNSFLRLWNHL